MDIHIYIYVFTPPGVKSNHHPIFTSVVFRLQLEWHALGAGCSLELRRAGRA